MRHERDAGDDGDEPDEPSHPADLALERALVVLHPFGKRRDAPQLGAHAGREDDSVRLTSGA